MDLSDTKKVTCLDPKRLLELEVQALRAERDLLQYMLKVRGEDIKQANSEYTEELGALKKDNLELHKQITDLSHILDKFIKEVQGNYRLVGHKLVCKTDSRLNYSRRSDEVSIILDEVPVFEWTFRSDGVSDLKQAIYNLGSK